MFFQLYSVTALLIASNYSNYSNYTTNSFYTNYKDGHMIWIINPYFFQ